MALCEVATESIVIMLVFHCLLFVLCKRNCFMGSSIFRSRLLPIF